MSVAQTSLLAYRGMKKLGDKQQQVFDAIGELGVASNEAIAEYLDWPINRVTGRVSELRKYGVVGLEGVGRGKSGMPAKLWSIRNKNDEKLLTIDCGA